MYVCTCICELLDTYLFNFFVQCLKLFNKFGKINFITVVSWCEYYQCLKEVNISKEQTMKSLKVGCIT